MSSEGTRVAAWAAALAAGLMIVAGAGGAVAEDDKRGEGNQGQGQGNSGSGDNSTRGHGNPGEEGDPTPDPFDGNETADDEGSGNETESEDDEGEDEGRSGNGDRGKGSDDEEEDEEEEDDDEGRPAKPEDERRPGRMVIHNQTVEGGYVSFVLDEASCEVRDLRVYGVAFFDRIALNATECEVDGTNRGSRLALESDDAKIRIHDAPNGLVRFDADDATITFDLAEGVTSNQTERGLDLQAQNLTGRLQVHEDEEEGESDANASLSFSGDVATATDEQGFFMVHPAKGNSPERRAVLDAIKEGKVGGEVDVIVDNGTVTTEALPFDDVIIKVHRNNESAYRFLVDANLTEGRTFVVNFAPGAFKTGHVGLRYWDVDNDSVPSEVAISRADDVSDVLETLPGEGPEYWVVHDEKGTHVMVAVPHFSVHVFEIQSLSLVELAQPGIVAGTLLGVAFVAAASFGMMARRKRE